jgi:hypothetical protein
MLSRAILVRRISKVVTSFEKLCQIALESNDIQLINYLEINLVDTIVNIERQLKSFTPFKKIEPNMDTKDRVEILVRNMLIIREIAYHTSNYYFVELIYKELVKLRNLLYFFKKI